MSKFSLMEFNALVGRDSYVLCSGKERIKKGEFDVDTAERHLFQGGSVGWWVRPGYVVVDVDEGKEQAKAMLKALGIKTLVAETNKGLHIYFKTDEPVKQGQGMTLPCGLKCDTRSAGKGYVLLPYGQPNRRFNKTREIAELPLSLTPLVKMKDSLLDLKEGEGRNAKAFAQLAAYKNNGATDEQVEIMGAVINQLIFHEPMDETEMGKIVENAKNCKDMSGNPYLIQNPKTGNYTQINQPAIRDHFINRGDTVVIGSRVFCYRDGIYKESDREVREDIEELIKQDAISLVTYDRINACVKFILNNSSRLYKPIELFNGDTNLVNFKNGVWDIEKRELVPHDPKYLQTIQIPHEVREPSCKWEDTRIYKFLNDICKLPPDDVDMIVDFMAYSLTTGNTLKSFMALYGPTNTGKSVLINFIKKVVGNQNTSSLTMENFKERFMPAELFGKVLNAAGDESSKALEDISFLKKITGEDTIKAEYKGEKPFDFKPFAKLLFSFNQLPLQLEEKSGAFYGRMRVLFMGKEIKLNDKYVRDLHSEDSILEALPHLLSRLPLSQIPRSVKSNSIIEGLREDSDSVHAFLKKKTKKGTGFTVKKTLYEAYVRFCNETGRTPHNYFNFNRSIKDQYREGRTPAREYCWKNLEIKKTKK